MSLKRQRRITDGVELRARDAPVGVPCLATSALPLGWGLLTCATHSCYRFVRSFSTIGRFTLLFLLWLSGFTVIYFWYLTMWPVLAGAIIAIRSKKVRYVFYGAALSYVGSLVGVIIWLACCARIHF